MKFYIRIFCFVLLAGLLCALGTEACAFGRMNAPPETPFEKYMLNIHFVGDLPYVITIGTFILKMIAYQGSLNSRAIGKLLLIHAGVFCAVLLMTGFVKDAYRPQLTVGLIFNWGLGTSPESWLPYIFPLCVLGFVFSALSAFEWRFFSEMKKAEFLRHDKTAIVFLILHTPMA